MTLTPTPAPEAATDEEIAELRMRLARASNEDRAYERPMTWPEADRLLARLSASEAGRRAAEEWQPIETAPKDGTWFIAEQDGETYPCEWHVEEDGEGGRREGWFDHFNQSFEAPTKWHRVPSKEAER